MTDEEKKKVTGPRESKKIFFFGNDEQLKSEGEYTIPATFCGVEITLNLDVIASSIRMLLTKAEMKNLDLVNGEIEILGVKEFLLTTISGHPAIRLRQKAEDKDNTEEERGLKTNKKEDGIQS